jgi:hypothetical protein
MFLSVHPVSIRGAARDRHGRRKQDAVDVRVLSARMTRADDNSLADGEGVWSCPPDAGDKSCKTGDVGPDGPDTPAGRRRLSSPALRGERAISS